MKNKKINIIAFIALSLILNVIFFNQSLYINAVEHGDVIDTLEIESKTNQYFPGSIIRMQGTWSIPNDSVDMIYKAGDTFSISIPDGLTANTKPIRLGEFALGQVVGDRIIFTFTEEIEGLANRNGGFDLMFTVTDPDVPGDHEVDIIMTDDKGNELLKDSIYVHKPEAGTVVPSTELFGKGSMGNSSSDDGLQWYIRINESGFIEGEYTSIEDSLGEDHILKPETLIVYEIIGQDYVDVTKNLDIIISDDLKTFRINNIPLTGGRDSFRHYTLNYDTEYTGKEISGTVKLDNTATLFTEKQGVLHPVHGDDNGIVTGDYYLGSGGWAYGERYVGFKLKKVDSVTKEPLANAQFKLTHKFQESIPPIFFSTDEEGIYEHPNQILNGVYILEELEAPTGYKLMKPQELKIKAEQNDYEIEVENELERISISVDKKWFNHEENRIDSHTDIAIALFANDQKIMQKVLFKGEESLTFNNLKQRDNAGEKITYRVEEVEIDGFTQDVKGDANNGFTITNRADEPPVIVEPTPETTELSVTKKWEGAPLEFVSVSLLRDDEVIDNIVLNELNNWTFEFNNLLKYDEDMQEYIYTVRELEHEGYNSMVSGSMLDGYTITNVEIEEVPSKSTLNIPVSKIWVGKPIESITVNLIKNGEFSSSLELSEENNWMSTFENLDVLDDLGNTNEYKVEEVNVKGYTSTIKGSMLDGFEITNTEIEEEVPNVPGIDILVNKIWIGQALESVTVNLYKNNEYYKSLELSEVNDWSSTFKELDAVDEDSNPIIYTIEEEEYDGYNSLISGSMTDGYIVTNIEIEEDLPSENTLSIPVSKIWIGNPLNSVTVNLYKNNELYKSLELSEENKWMAIFENLDIYDADSNEIEYTILEEEIESYVSIITGSVKEGFEITNTEVIPEKPLEKEPPYPLEPSKTPNTGLSNNSFYYLLITLLSFSIIILTSTKRRKKKNL